MKRIIIITVLLLLVITSFGCKKKEKMKDEAGHLIVAYKTYPFDRNSEDMDNYPYVKIFSDRKVEWGYGDGIIVNYTSIDKDLYDNIVSLAFSDTFTSLKGDISDNPGDDYRYITIYYENGSSKTIGGAGPINETFLELEDRISKIYNTDHE